MSVILFIVIFGIGTTLAEVPGQLTCLQCPKARNGSDCTKRVSCANGEICQASAYATREGIFYSFGCGDVKACLSPTSLIGRRRFLEIVKPAVQPKPTGIITGDAQPELCFECCKFEMCNANLCPESHFKKTPHFSPTPALLATTKPTTTPQPTTTEDPGDPNCRDLEEDGIKCSVLDFAEICHDTSMFAQVLRWKKCPKTCGLCHAPKNATSTFVAPPTSGNACVDFEQDSILCVYLDLFDMCTSRTKLSLVVASEKCPRHCGYCHDTTTTQSTIPTTTTTVATTTTQPETTTTLPTTTTQQACEDVEDATFTCREWASHGYCLPFPGVGYETAKVRCRKFCGFCK